MIDQGVPASHAVIYLLNGDQERHTCVLRIFPTATPEDVASAISAGVRRDPSEVTVLVISPAEGEVPAAPRRRRSIWMPEEEWPSDLAEIGRLDKLMVDARLRARNRQNREADQELTAKITRLRQHRQRVRNALTMPDSSGDV